MKKSVIYTIFIIYMAVFAFSLLRLFNPMLNNFGIVMLYFGISNSFKNFSKTNNYVKTIGYFVDYEIYDMFETTPEDTEFMTRDTEGRREISLSTCTDDVQQRLIVLAREKQ